MTELTTLGSGILVARIVYKECDHGMQGMPHADKLPSKCVIHRRSNRWIVGRDSCRLWPAEHFVPGVSSSID
jgi:hypothetical protein